MPAPLGSPETTAHSPLSNRPITSHYGQFSNKPNLSSAVGLFAITQNSISPALTHHTLSPKLPPLSHISNTKSSLRHLCYHRLSPLPHFTPCPLIPPPMKAPVGDVPVEGEIAAGDGGHKSHKTPDVVRSPSPSFSGVLEQGRDIV
ncbi:unnamed protein product [Pleuronectes platessa]|uniref:Uncharacterized protein n=1 Tax=Pleuronectes platessa TaxID=8262 RepID=A0A9N7VF12_PLEPL|nr:unnamed protein product [Pleuronectes platessa]